MAEPVNKQHLLAEDAPLHDMIPSLCDMFYYRSSNFIAMAVFSAGDKKMLSYKIALPVENIQAVEPWFNENFNTITEVATDTDYEAAPADFRNPEKGDRRITGNVSINRPDHSNKSIHYMSVLIQYHLAEKKSAQLYIFSTASHYHILLMDRETCYLANAYKCDSHYEVLYFLLNSLQISDILPSDTTLNADISILENSALTDFIRPHFSQFTPLRVQGIAPHRVVESLAEKLFACNAAALCG